MFSSKNTQHKKSLLLVVPINFKFNEVVRACAEQAGFSVLEISYNMIPKFSYASFKDHAIWFFKKNFTKDKGYKTRVLRVKHQSLALSQIIKKFVTKQYDYALFIRPDLFYVDTIAELTKHAHTNICYQWDGFKRYPEIHNYLPFFDRVFVFDRADYDANNPKLAMSTNFWFDIFTPKIANIPSQNKGVLYIGTYERNRMKTVFAFKSYLEKLGMEHQFYIYFDNENIPLVKEFKGQKGLTVLTESLSYAEMIDLEKDYDVIVDFQNPLHEGLSFRHYEAMAMNKKIITTNKEAYKYDFYSPNNTFLLNDQNWDALPEFLASPTTKVSPEILKKYSFSNWINYVLDLKPHDKMEGCLHYQEPARKAEAIY